MKTNSSEQEIDLSQVGKAFFSFFQNIIDKCFDLLFFLKKKVLVIIALFVIGVSLGIFLDRSSTKYNSDIIVTPNLGGVDYLYAKIKLINSKLKEGDTSFLKKIGISDTENIIDIKIEPIIDIYTFVNSGTAVTENSQGTQNFELMKLFAENEDINKVIKDEITSKNYQNHKITIITSSKVSYDEIIKPILNYLNSDAYLNNLLAITKDNILIKSKKNEEQLLQVDKIINQISDNLSKVKSTSNLVYNNENNEINALFTLKNSLLNEIANQKIQLENIKVFIKDLSTTMNVIESKGLNNKWKLVLPVLFVLVYLLFYAFSRVYKRQKQRVTS